MNKAIYLSALRTADGYLVKGRVARRRKANEWQMAEDEAECAVAALEEQLNKLELLIPNVLGLALQYEHEQKAEAAPQRVPVGSVSHADGAYAHAALAFSINSLFYIYARSQGMDVSSHPVLSEVARVKALFSRLKTMTETNEAAAQKSNRGAEGDNLTVLTMSEPMSSGRAKGLGLIGLDEMKDNCKSTSERETVERARSQNHAVTKLSVSESGLSEEANARKSRKPDKVRTKSERERKSADVTSKPKRTIVKEKKRRIHEEKGNKKHKETKR